MTYVFYLAITNRIYKQNHRQDTVLKTLLKTSDKKSQIHSDLKGIEIYSSSCSFSSLEGE